MLDAVKIPFQTFDTNGSPTLPPEDYRHLLTPSCDFDLGRYSHVIELFSSHAPKSPDRVHALLAFWEYESGFDFAFPGSTQSRMPLIAMSDFNARHFRSILSPNVPVFKIRYPLLFKGYAMTPPEVIRARYHIQPGTFIVFFNFDYGSSYYRKNPEAVLKAFAKAFSPKDDVVLLLKTSHAKQYLNTAKRLRTLAEELSLVPNRLIIIDGAVPQCDMSGLFNACDVYISLHRGEGFGIGMAEAMSCGKPVIATNYSANTEFCTKETSIPVPFSLTKPSNDEIDHPAYRNVTSWAEPDIEFAASALARCRSDRAFAMHIGSQAALFIRNYFSPENFKNDVEHFLDQSPPSRA